MLLLDWWVPVIGYEKDYFISYTGRIRSIKNRFKKEKLMSLTPDKNGYLTVRLMKNGKGRTTKVHRIVACAFINNKNNFP